MRTTRLILVASAALAALTRPLVGCTDDAPECGDPQMEDVTEPPDVALAVGATTSVAVHVFDACGDMPGVSVDFQVTLGGGAVSAASVTTGADGRATTSWTLSASPVRQELSASASGLAEAPATDPTLDWFVLAAPLPTADLQTFGDVEGFLQAEGFGGSTEDLAFVGEGDSARLVMGAPEGLLEVAPDGTVTRRTLSGEPVGRAWGIAAGADGALWAVDAGASTIVHIDKDGAVTTRLTDDGTVPLVGPNYIAVGPDGDVYITDPCLGELIRFDPDTDTVVDVEVFDRSTDGGPNGLAFGRDGRLYGMTENTVALCSQAGVAEPDDPLAQLFVIEVTATGFGAREALATGLGVFGDGLAFDAEDNLYMVVDTVDLENFALEASYVLVRRAQSGEVVRLLDSSPNVIANVAFGRGPYGETTLYASLLQIPFLTPDAKRGLRRIELGIPGLPLSH
ncbi:MAG: SMP-30/gluconolactonase/LRE family protein [Deltaproteobacteria bacterium]|nr:SMP-30/gluconolactonase/LRE family protein [Deltaproteobacteria bacterium]MCB9787037.1 SMP-30/gluconolactonase/LRE family protein [Deltaproteobacteria bacterium]